MRLHPHCVIAVLMIWLPACSGGGGSGDGSVDGFDADGTGADEAAGDDGSGDDMGPPFRLVFEEGARVCAQFVDQRSAPQELALRGRIEFVAGEVELPRNLDQLEIDLIDRALVRGPQPVEASPAGPGAITHREETALWGWCHHYTYRQAFEAGTRPFTVEATFSFCLRNGEADPDVLVFDPDTPGEEPKGLVEDHRVAILGLLGAGEDYFTEKQFYRSCTYPALPLHHVTAELEGGDRVIIHKRMMKPLMGSGPVGLVHAEVHLDDQEQEIDDYFRLAYGADLHNFNERYLVALDPPLGNVYGVYFAETSENEPPGTAALLDADLDPAQPFATRAVTAFSDLEQ